MIYILYMYNLVMFCMDKTVILEMDDLFPHAAATVLDGLKAVGKTTAAQRAARSMSLDRTAERAPLRPILSCSYLVQVLCS